MQGHILLARTLLVAGVDWQARCVSLQHMSSDMSSDMRCDMSLDMSSEHAHAHTRPHEVETQPCKALHKRTHARTHTHTPPDVFCSGVAGCKLVELCRVRGGEARLHARRACAAEAKCTPPVCWQQLAQARCRG